MSFELDFFKASSLLCFRVVDFLRVKPLLVQVDRPDLTLPTRAAVISCTETIIDEAFGYTWDYALESSGPVRVYLFLLTNLTFDHHFTPQRFWRRAHPVLGNRLEKWLNEARTSRPWFCTAGMFLGSTVAHVAGKKLMWHRKREDYSLVQLCELPSHTQQANIFDIVKNPEVTLCGWLG